MEQDDWVLFKYRESGQLRFKIVAKCIEVWTAPSGTEMARLDVPFGTFNTITVPEYEGEMEVVGHPSEVNF